MMKNNWILCLFVGLVIGSCQINDQGQTKTETIKKEPNDWMFRQRSYPSGMIDEDAFRKAVKYREQQKEEQLTNNSEKDLISNQWIFSGPTNVGGRITDVEMTLDETPVIYIGAASGGVFKSDDMGENWIPIFDEQPTLSIGDIAVAQSNTDVIYVGTGEANAGGGSLTYDGMGIFRSSDGGDSWENTGPENLGSIGRVLIDPNDPNRVYTAAMGKLFTNNTERGVYRSLDGGGAWEQVLFVSDSTGAIDLAMHPSEPMTLYAAMWERVRRPDRRAYYGTTSGVYKSTDGGTTWEELTNGLPNDPTSKGRISVAIAPSNPQVVYAAYVNAAGLLSNIYRSNDAGLSWSDYPTTGLGAVPYDWWFNRILVHPDNEDKLYYIGLELNEYNPVAQNWSISFSGVHVDQHSLWINPQNPDFMLLGNDGGLYLSTDGGQSNTKWDNLPITQFYACEIDEQNPEKLYGGTQDNGTQRTTTGNVDDWEHILGGDGFRVLVDPNNSNIVYAEYQYGNIFKSTDGGDNFSYIANPMLNYRRNWFTPFIIDPLNSNTLYYGTERVFKSVNAGATWNIISPDLSNGNLGNNGIIFGTITSLSVSKLDNQVIWAGTDDGNVWLSNDGGQSWQNVSNTLPNRWVTSIEANPHDVSSAYVTFSSYRFGSNLGHVFKTENQGVAWVDISNDLPDIPINDLAVDPQAELIFIATDIGVFFSYTPEYSWTLLGQGLPSVVVMDIDIHESSRMLLAATFGRSMWSIFIDTEVNTNIVQSLSIDWNVFPNPAHDKAMIEVNIPDNNLYTIEVFSMNGQRVSEIHAGFITAGKHHFEYQTDQLARGVYMIRCTNKEGQSIERKLVLQ